jgi:hypothetical protein
VDRRRLLRSAAISAGVVAVGTLLKWLVLLVLLEVVVSRVLSPQYMIWLAGLSAVVLSAGTRRLARPAWVAVGAVVITAGLYQAPAAMLIRNTALLFAAIDASIAMVLLLRTPAGARGADRPAPARAHQASERFTSP